MSEESNFRYLSVSRGSSGIEIFENDLAYTLVKPTGAILPLNSCRTKGIGYLKAGHLIELQWPLNWHLVDKH